jgi:uroporphyrin-III C-methyltransferase
MQTKACVSIVGTGPGDPDLLTIKAVNTIRKAGVVACEQGIDGRIIEFFATHNLQYMPVGDCVAELVLEQAKTVGHIAFLVTGDSSVSGVAFEIMRKAACMGVHVHVIPGIPNEIALPTAAGIPLTKRRSNESFCVMNGSELENCTETALSALRSSATIVIRSANDLATVFQTIRSERGEHEPCALIDQTSEPNVIGTVGELSTLSTNRSARPGAFVIVGKVVLAKMFIGSEYYESHYIHR